MNRIAVVDDNHLLRENIISRLQDKYSIYFETDQATELIQDLDSKAISRHPQVVLMDIEMDDMDGIYATALIKTKFPHIKIIMLTVFEQEEKVWDSILAGADGYILKDEPREKLLSGIEDVLNDGSYMSPSIARKAITLLQRESGGSQSALLSQLSRREKEILEMIAVGKRYKQIAEALFLSVSTVKTHVHKVYEKLQVTNKMEAAELLKKAPKIR